MAEPTAKIDNPELQQLLEAKRLAEEQVRAVNKLFRDNGYRESHKERMRRIRRQASMIEIPDVADQARRDEALSCPLKFKATYFADRFYMSDASHHIEMTHAICHVAQYGGDQAISAPRGEGKTMTATVTLIYAVLKGWIKFPVIVAQTGPHAERIFKDVKYQFETNDLLVADFQRFAYRFEPLKEPLNAGRLR